MDPPDFQAQRQTIFYFLGIMQDLRSWSKDKRTREKGLI